MNDASTGRAWRGFLASLILTGAGQFLAGARRRGIIWFVAIYAGYLSSLMVYNWSFVPAKSGLLLLCIWPLVWLIMLYDSCRPVRALPWWSWIALVLGWLALSQIPSALAHQFFRAYRMPTESMLPTFIPGDELMVCRGAYWFREPQRGDLIILKTSGIAGIPKDPGNKEVLYLKRLVGLPRDKVEIGAGSLWINKTKTEFGRPSHPVEYYYRNAQILPRGVDTYIVPDGQYFMLGDNSRNSYDSRYWGTISRAAIDGKVTKIYWPWNRISTPQ